MACPHVKSRHSSFAGAAHELHLTPAAIREQIRLLEKHLNVDLFKHLPHGVTLTDMEQAYALPIKRAFEVNAVWNLVAVLTFP